MKDRRAEKTERALKAARQQVEAVQHALLSNGPLLPFLIEYDRLDQAAEPLQGRRVEGGSRPHPFDRPMPHLSTGEAREMQRRVDRALSGLLAGVVDWFNGEPPPRDRCLACGGGLRSGRPPYRRRRVEAALCELLAGGPVAESVVLATVDAPRSTVRRAAEVLGVGRVLEGGVWYWQLPEREER